MKKAITITFGLIGLIFGLVFLSIKINGAEITSGIYTYYGKKDNNTGIFQVYAPDLTTIGESEYLNYRDFFVRFETLTGDNSTLIIMNIQTMDIEYEDGADVNYWGYADTIIIDKQTLDIVDISFWYKGELKATVNIDYFVPYKYPFVKIITSDETLYQNGYESGLYDGYANGYQDGYDQGYLVGMNENETSFGEGYNKGYDIGYRKGNFDGQGEGFNKGWDEGYKEGVNNGFNNGYEEGASTTFENGFGGIRNPFTDTFYKDEDSYSYGLGHQEGYEEGLGFDAFGWLKSIIYFIGWILNVQFIPGISLGRIAMLVLFIYLIPFIFRMFGGSD